ncbi:MAG: hypothetical protein ACI4NV_05125 [Thermoguttaceae bacterium]
MDNRICYLRLLLEYGQEPLWRYDYDGGVIDVGLLPEWENDKELYNLTYQLSNEYDALFIANEKEFSYVGFKDEKHRLSFCALADLFATKVYQKNSGQYRIINDLKLDDWHSSIGI